MAHVGRDDSMGRHRAANAAEAGFSYGYPGDPGERGCRAWAWGNPEIYLNVPFRDVLGHATLANELEKLDQRLRTLAEGGEQTLPEVPGWLAGVVSFPVPITA